MTGGVVLAAALAAAAVAVLLAAPNRRLPPGSAGPARWAAGVAADPTAGRVAPGAVPAGRRSSGRSGPAPTATGGRAAAGRATPWCGPTAAAPAGRVPLRGRALDRLPAGPAAAGAALLASVPAGPVGGVLVAAAVLAASGARRRARSDRLRRDAETGVRDACAALAAALRAGRPADAALEAAADAAGPAAAALRRAAAGSRLGVPVPALLRAAPAEEGGPALRHLAAAWQVSAGSGAALAGVSGRLADVLDRQAGHRDDVAAALAGARSAARVLALLPLVGVGLAQLVGADPLHLLLRTPLGVLLLVVALGLDAVGLLWTGRLVRAALRA